MAELKTMRACVLRVIGYKEDGVFIASLQAVNRQHGWLLRGVLQNGSFARPSGVGGAAQNDNAGCVRLCFGLRALIECLQAGESTRSNAIRQMP